MKPHNPHYISTCKISTKLLPLIISSFLFGCSELKETKQVLPSENKVLVSESAININTASAETLEKLPHFGTTLAQKIIAHRDKFGKFRKTEFLMLIDGVSDKQYRELKALVRVE